MQFTSLSHLERHIKGCVLGKSLKHLQFQTRAEMETWIEQMQEKTNSFFSAQQGIVSTERVKYQYKFCQHNQRQSIISNPTPRITDRKRKCGLVPNFSCPAKLSICEGDLGFTVSFRSEHNHDLGEENLKYQPFPRSLCRDIKAQLGMRIDAQTIYENESTDAWSRENRDSAEITKKSCLKKRYAKMFISHL